MTRELAPLDEGREAEAQGAPEPERAEVDGPRGLGDPEGDAVNAESDEARAVVPFEVA